MGLPETARQAEQAQSDTRLETAKARWTQADVEQKSEWLARMDPVSQNLAHVNEMEVNRERVILAASLRIRSDLVPDE